jgi:hypothetical protein
LRAVNVGVCGLFHRRYIGGPDVDAKAVQSRGAGGSANERGSGSLGRLLLSGRRSGDGACPRYRRGARGRCCTVGTAARGLMSEMLGRRPSFRRCLPTHPVGYPTNQNPFGGASVDLTACPDPKCVSLAEVVWRAVLESTDGPVEFARTRCLAGHAFNLPVEWLAASTAAVPRLLGDTAAPGSGLPNA